MTRMMTHPVLYITLVMSVIITPTSRLVTAQFGDGIGKVLDPKELLNQLILSKLKSNNFNIETPNQINNDETVIEVTEATPFPTTSSLRPLSISSNMKIPQRSQSLRRTATNEKTSSFTDKKHKNNACHGRNCEEDATNDVGSRWSMPLISLGSKQYYLGIFFKANWYKSAQYCRFHGMNLAAIENERENRVLEAHVQQTGLGNEHFWTSGTDQGEEGRFFWMSNGRPLTFENWNAGEPNNFQYEDGEMEHCLELWNRDGKGLKWNDSPCSFETFFICEVP